METKRTMVLSFHVCRGGRFYNPGHVEFVGEETFSDVCSMLSDRLFTNYDRYYTIEIEDIDDLSDSELEAIRAYKGYMSEDLERLIKVDDDEENEEDEE